MEINWQQFGLKTNPYDTTSLTEGGDLDLEKAFVGRQHERRVIDDLFRSNDRVCLTVCGDTGVGKTSLVNYEKVIWKYSDEQKQLFSSRFEIQASDVLLDKQSFILEIIGSVLREIQLMQSDLMQHELLANLQQLVDVRQSMNISGGVNVGYAGHGMGVNVSKAKQGAPSARFAMSALEHYFNELLEFIKTHDIKGRRYNGLIVHVNNFDWVLAREGGYRKAREYFNEVRDLLQTPGTYFVFLGSAELFAEVIAKEQRVKSVFVRTPIVVEPLGKREVVEAFEKRMQLLMSDGVSAYVKPIENEVIYKLHDLYNGDIRSIMEGVRDVLRGYSDSVVQTLSLDEAMVLLGEERWSKIRDVLKPQFKAVLECMIEHGEPMGPSEVAQVVKKSSSNISGYYFPKLRELNVIEEKEREGKKIRYGLTTDFLPLRWWMDSQRVVGKHTRDAVVGQPSLFE